MEVVPVPRDYVHLVWEPAARICRWFGNDYDINRLHQRLLVGRNLLWLALNDNAFGNFQAVVVTSITEQPPTQQRRFWTRDPANARSLAIHLVNGIRIQSWIESAVERITEYGLANGCRKLFLMASRGWQHYALQFGAGFDTVAFSRDRPTRPHFWEHAHRHRRQFPGFYCEVNPAAPRRRLVEVLPTGPLYRASQGDSEFYRALQARRKTHGRQKKVEVPDDSLNPGR